MMSQRQQLLQLHLVEEVAGAQLQLLQQLLPPHKVGVVQLGCGGP